MSHDIWNPWHGCIKYSEGCEHCYMYYLDKQRGLDSRQIYKVKGNFDYPLHKDRYGNFKIKSGETLRVCMTSDFFLEEADQWRADIWDIIAARKDVIFYILTKRANRIESNLPKDWGKGWENVILNVTCENQTRADERIPILLNIPAKHKGIMIAPMIGQVSISEYLKSNQIEQVICGGENYDGCRPCRYEWVERLYNQCKQAGVKFCWTETGTKFIKDGKLYTIPDKQIQAIQAYKSGLQYEGQEIKYKLTDNFGMPISKLDLYTPLFMERCNTCGSRLICNGCSNCGKCDKH